MVLKFQKQKQKNNAGKRKKKKRNGMWKKGVVF